MSNNTGSGAKTVSGNIVGANLICTDNAPPFEGSGNPADRLIGQCTSRSG